MSKKSVEDRLYKCFEDVFDKYNGNLRGALNQSSIVYDSAGYSVSDEFLQEMYEKWLKIHEDKGENNDSN